MLTRTIRFEHNSHTSGNMSRHVDHKQEWSIILSGDIRSPSVLYLINLRLGGYVLPGVHYMPE